jgi:cyclohexadienyl dehydratase
MTGAGGYANAAKGVLMSKRGSKVGGARWLIAVQLVCWAALAPFAFPAAAQAADATLRVCTPGDYPPYSLRDSEGRYSGVDIDLIRGFADITRRQLSFVPVTWASLPADFDAQCDVAVGGISDNPDRRRFADFSISYGRDGKTPITRRSDADAYSTIESINRPEVRVIANRGGTNELFARTNFPEAQLTIWPENVTIFEQLENGRADVFVTDAVEARYRVQRHPDLQVLHPETPFDTFQKIFMVRKSDVMLGAMLNAWLATRIADGTVDHLFANWIGGSAHAN